MTPAPGWIVKRVLLGPASVRRAAAKRAEPHERWMLMQDAEVRRSYVREVLENGRNEDAWMLHQPDHVRHSYVAEVLEEDSAA